MNPKYIFLLLPLFLLVRCEPSDKVVTKKKSKNSFESSIPNQLSSKEIASGWELLFDGKDTSKWRTFRSDFFPKEGWKIDDEGNLIAENTNLNIVTHRRFENFDLKIDFQISPNSDSGIYYCAQENQDSNIWNQALEFQIIDPKIIQNAGDFSIGKHSTGDLYNLLESKREKLFFEKKWNRARIVILNNYVEHWLNGELILQFKIGDKNWKSIVTKSKFWNYPAFSKKQNGQIALAGSQSKIKFRNIKIKEL